MTDTPAPRPPEDAAVPTLADRYLHAVGRLVPDAQRGAIQAEVRERIADAVDARLAHGPAVGAPPEDPAAAERAVLTELGDPARLVADYLDRPKQLLGPRYYFTWRRLVRLLLVIVLPCVAFAMAIAGGVNGTPIGGIIGSAIGVTITVGVHLVCWTTLVFVLLDRYGERLSDGHLPPDAIWDVEQLPRIETPAARTSAWSLVGAVFWLAVLAAALVLQQFEPWASPDGSAVPLIDPVHWALLLPYLLGLLAASVALSVATHLQRRRTWWGAALHAALSAAFLVPVLWLWSQGRLVNPAFDAAVGIDAAGDTVRTVGIVLGIIAGAVALGDIAGGFRGAWQDERAARGA